MADEVTLVTAGRTRRAGVLGSADGLERPHVRMTVAETRKVLAERWGRYGEITRVATEKDDTFMVDGEDGERYVLKISNPADDPAEVDFEVRLLDHVGRANCGVPVQQLYPDRAGRILASIDDEAGQRRQARLMSYLAGTPLDSTDSSPRERQQVGRMLARLRHATATFSHPAQGRTLAWDVQHLPTLRPLLPHVADPERRELVAAGLARFERVAPVLPALRRQVLHNDFSRSNIIVDHDDPAFVRGIIDFGDAVHTAVAVDVSTALVNQLPRQVPDGADTDLFADARDVLRGYLDVADLTAAELAAIPYLVMGRVVARALITLYRAELMPDNARYILRNTEPGWAQLRWFLRQTDDRLESILLSEARSIVGHGEPGTSTRPES